MHTIVQTLAQRLTQAAGEAAGAGDRDVASSPAFEAAERTVEQAVQWLRLVIESTGAVIIALGLVVGAVAFVRAFLRRRDARDAHVATEGYNGVRLTLARYLALALEFQLGADILSTAIAPSWNQIGKLGAIAVIRTALNYFLEKEMREEAKRAELRDRSDGREQAEEPTGSRRDGRGAPARAGGPGVTGRA